MVELNEEKIGTLKKIEGEGYKPLAEYQYYAFYCNRCGSCKIIDQVYMKNARFSQICPPYARHSFPAYSAQGKMDIALGMLAGELDYTPRLPEIIYQCTLGGACDVMCKRSMDLEPLLTIEALRRKCVEDGKGPMPEHLELKGKVEESNNIYAEPHLSRLKWIPEDVKLTEEADTLYFVGCNAAYRQQQIARSTAKVLKAAGIGFVVSPEEVCCGYHLLSTGQWEKARELMEHNLDMIRRLGVSKVITSCASCYKTLKVDYPKLLGISTEDLGFDVLHTTELLSQLTKSGALNFPSNLEMRVTYHDPCGLGRLSEPWEHYEGEREKWGVYKPPKKWRRGSDGVYEPPREILRSIPGVVLKEMDRVRENAWCCGAGGGVKQAFPDMALWSAEERLEEAKTTGSEAIVTACPFCKENLEDAIEAQEVSMKVYDIMELAAQALDGRIKQDDDI